MAKSGGSAGRSGKKALSQDEIISTLTSAGGKRWQKGGHDRIYFDARAALSDLSTDRYKTGNISSATFKGQAISNSEARRLITEALETKLYYDLKTNVIMNTQVSYGAFEKPLKDYISKLYKLIRK